MCEVKDFLEEIAVDFPAVRDLNLKFEKVRRSGTWTEYDSDCIKYSDLTALGRGVGGVLSGLSGREESRIRRAGVMLDVSRNGVMKPEAVKTALRRLALMGIHEVFLYAEDVYQLPGFPAFGAYRGAYSWEEIHEFDLCAQRLGIELIGCIQTLGHLEQFLKWSSTMKFADVKGVLEVDNPEVYALIDSMLDFWSTALSSRRIHIGMDEAHGLGTGRFLDKHGFVDRTELFNRHLTEVKKRCDLRGLKPMIWSDMYFRLGSQSHTYYDTDVEFPCAVTDSIPEDVQLVYWDYYHDNEQTYLDLIECHRKLGRELIFAGALRITRNFSHDMWLSEKTFLPGFRAAVHSGLSEVMLTLWSDDGAYSSFNSVWSGIAGAAGVIYGADTMTGARAGARANAIAGRDFQRDIAASALEYHCEERKINDRISAGQLWWDDPLLGIAYRGYKSTFADFEERICHHYRNLAGTLGCTMDYPGTMAQALYLKTDLHRRLFRAYGQHDTAELKKLADEHIPRLIELAEQVSENFRREWYSVYRPNGFETIQLRQAGLICRLQETQRRIEELLSGKVEKLEELEHPEGDFQYITFFYRESAVSGFF